MTPLPNNFFAVQVVRAKKKRKVFKTVRLPHKDYEIQFDPNVPEEWRDVPSYPDLQASNKGRVRTTKSKVLAQYIDQKGYARINLRYPGVHGKSTQSVHRFIAEAFIPNPENKAEVNHKNAIKHDNRIENLEWCTPAENCAHRDKNKLGKHYKGRAHPDSIQVTQFTMDGEKVADFECARYTMPIYGGNGNQVLDCCRGFRKSFAGFMWRFTDPNRMNKRMVISVNGIDIEMTPAQFKLLRTNIKDLPSKIVINI